MRRKTEKAGLEASGKGIVKYRKVYRWLFRLITKWKMTVKEFIEKLQRLDGNLKLEFEIFEAWNYKTLDWSYITEEDWKAIIEVV